MTASALTGSLTGASSSSSGGLHIFLGSTGGTINNWTSDVATTVHWDTVRIEETGSHDGVHADFEITDLTRAYAAIRGEWPVKISRISSGVEDVFFLGFIRQPSGRYEARYGGLSMSAIDFSSLLDRDQVKTQFKIAGGTNAKAAIQTCFNTMTLVSQYLGGAGIDWSKTRNDLGEDGLGTFDDPIKFEVGLTLRQCVERILGEVSATANYRMDCVVVSGGTAQPRLWTWDANTPAFDGAWLTNLASPYDINVTHNPSGTEVAPEEFQHSFATEQRISAVTIDGAKAAGSGTFADRDQLPQSLWGDTIDKFGHYILPGPWSGDIFGEAHAALTGQPSTTVKQAIRLARAALVDLRNPIPNGSFTLREDSCYNGTKRWQGGQYVYVTSPAHALQGRNNDTSDGTSAGTVRPWAGETAGTSAGTRWALQPFRISRVTTEFLNGAGDLKQTIEYGGRRLHLSQV